MAKPGRAPKPYGLRLVEGTDARGRTGRTLDRSKEPVAPVGDMEPPYPMSDDLLAEWKITVAALEKMDLASPADRNQIAAYCEAVILHRQSSRMLKETSILVMGTAKTLVINKLILIQRESANQMLRFAQEFGLTPSARTRVEVARGDGAGTNPFA